LTLFCGFSDTRIRGRYRSTGHRALSFSLALGFTPIYSVRLFRFNRIDDGAAVGSHPASSPFFLFLAPLFHFGTNEKSFEVYRWLASFRFGFMEITIELNRTQGKKIKNKNSRSISCRRAPNGRTVHSFLEFA
jgi:hypothetical protein